MNRNSSIRGGNAGTGQILRKKEKIYIIIHYYFLPGKINLMGKKTTQYNGRREKSPENRKLKVIVKNKIGNEI